MSTVAVNLCDGRHIRMKVARQIPKLTSATKLMQIASTEHENSPVDLSREVAKKKAVLQKLLVAYDLSSASGIALRYATEIARRFNSEIVLAHIQSAATLDDKTDAGLANANIEQPTERQPLDLLANQLRLKGIKVSHVARRGSVTEVVVQLVAECKPDLLLMGAPDHAADHTTLGSTAEYLLRSLSCPVLLVGPSVPDPSTRGVKLSEIVYASSCPPAVGGAPELACELARRFATHIHIVHVEPAESCGMARSSQRELEMREEKIADHFRRLGVGSSWTLRFGSQQDHLLDQAQVVSADRLCFGLVHPATDTSQMGTLDSIIYAAEYPILTIPGTA